MSKIHFVPVSSNSKTGPIPVTYSARETCPESCPHYRTSCYADAGFHTRMVWDKVNARGSSVADVADAIRALPPGTLWRHNIAGDLPGAGETVDPVALGEIVRANIGRRGFTYTHKKSLAAIEWAQHATAWGFTVNLSADDAGECDALADAGLPLTCIVPTDTPKHSTTPGGLPIVVCPAQTSDDITCATCGLCQRANRAVVVGFRAHGTRARVADAKARRVIPIAKI